jgi:hypothetical protein
MAKETDSNKKLPKSPTMDTGNKPISRMEISQRPDGQGSIVYSPYEKEEIEQYSFEELWSPMGSFETRASHNKTELKTNLNFETRGYNIGGHSTTHETHVETYVQDTRKVTVEGDNSKEIGRNNYEVTAGKKVSSSLEGTIDNSGAGSSEAPTYKLSEGDVIQEHSGHYHQAFGGDKIQTVTENKLTIIKEGDHAIHVQKGNYDVQVTAGKLHLMTSGDELIANSNVRILLQVGQYSKVSIGPLEIKLQVGETSYIQITPDGIKMIGPRIDLN